MNISNTKKEYVAFSLRMVLGLTFLISGILKLMDIYSFKFVIYNLRLFTSHLIPFVSFTIPFIEIILGILLLAGLFTKFAYIYLTVLVLVFLVVTIYAIKINVRGGCGCFGTIISGSFNWNKISVQILILFVDVLLIFSKEERFRIDKLLKNCQLKVKNEIRPQKRFINRF